MEIFRTAKGHLAAVKTYQPGKPIEELEREYGIKGAVKMASNENPLGPSPKAVAALRRSLSKLHLYPDGGCFYLRQKLAKRLSVSPESLVFGNGSDELLVLLVRAFVGAGDEIIIAEPTFLIYEIATQVEQGRAIAVPVKNFQYDLDEMASRITRRTKLIFIANPDNPIGTYVDCRKLSRFLKRVPDDVLVVLDEAYCDFAEFKKDYPDSLALLDSGKNVVITRTFSKAYGLSGLRIGYAIARPDVAAALNKVREPFNVNSAAQIAAIAALDDRAFLRRTLRVVSEGRRFLVNELRRRHLSCVDTVTNFILVDLGRDAQPIYKGLLERGVIVRPMNSWGLDTFLRVTVGKPADNRRFLKALDDVLSSPGAGCVSCCDCCRR